LPPAGVVAVCWAKDGPASDIAATNTVTIKEVFIGRLLRRNWTMDKQKTLNPPTPRLRRGKRSHVSP